MKNFSREDRVVKMRVRQNIIVEEKAILEKQIQKLSDEWNDLQMNAYELTTLRDFDNEADLTPLSMTIGLMENRVKANLDNLNNRIQPNFSSFNAATSLIK